MPKSLHLIGNSHIDPVWLWRADEGLQTVHATFRAALDLMNEHGDFVFTASSAAFYAWIEEIDPAMFAEIKARVAEGRWCIVGGWWVEPDCNIPSGESFVRQALYGQRYFQYPPPRPLPLLFSEQEQEGVGGGRGTASALQFAGAVL